MKIITDGPIDSPGSGMRLKLWTATLPNNTAATMAPITPPRQGITSSTDPVALVQQQVSRNAKNQHGGIPHHGR